MNAHTPLETRSALPLETRSDDNTDPLAAATAAVEELRSASTEFRTQQQNELRSVTDRLAALETRLSRPMPTQENRDDTPAEVRAFNSFARYGVERMDTDEVRALTVSTDTAGGYLAPEQFIRELDRNLVLFSPIRTVARVTNASAGELILPKRTGTMTASWAEAETEASTETQPTYGQQRINIYELRCHVDVSNRLLEDAAFNLDAELAFDFAEEFGRAEGHAFILGDGSSKPTGLLNTPGIDTLDTDGAILTADHLIDLFHDLPGAYASRAVWAMNRSTIGEVRKLKNNAGDYLWQDAISAGNPPTILGRPVIEFPDMPSINPADEATPIVFGDFMSAFRIFDRVNLSVLRDPFSQQTNGLVRFHARRRVGGAVTKTEALRLLKVTP